MDRARAESKIPEGMTAFGLRSFPLLVMGHEQLDRRVQMLALVGCWRVRGDEMVAVEHDQGSMLSASASASVTCRFQEVREG